MEPEPSPSTVYFDGSCPLCRAEIAVYQRVDETGACRFVDVSDPAASVPAGLTRDQAMKRFHVRAGDGRLLSGAAAFVEVWSRLPQWRWAARIAAWPGMLAVLEVFYRLFLPVRPLLSRMFGGAQRLMASVASARRA
jgi:predicted DCC family thiol-disulfide oxidoreductase YuxK